MNYKAIDTGNDFLAHHGILGQKWGQKNGPPYPLGSGDHSSKEEYLAKRTGTKLGKSSGLGHHGGAAQLQNGKFIYKWRDYVKQTGTSSINREKVKKALLIAGGVALVSIGTYAAYKYIKSRGAGSIESSLSDKGELAIEDLLKDGERESELAAAKSIAMAKELNSSSTINSITSGQLNAIHMYSGGSSGRMNGILRGTISSSEFSTEENQLLNAANKSLEKVLSKSNLQKDVNVYRGITGKGVSRYLGEDVVSSIQKVIDENSSEKSWNVSQLAGVTYKEKGFLSTSLFEDIGESFGRSHEIQDGVVIDIKALKGLNGLALGDLSSMKYEGEVLFKQGTNIVFDGSVQRIHGTFHLGATLIQGD